MESDLKNIPSNQPAGGDRKGNPRSALISVLILLCIAGAAFYIVARGKTGGNGNNTSLITEIPEIDSPSDASGIDLPDLAEPDQKTDTEVKKDSETEELIDLPEKEKKESSMLFYN